MAKDGGPAFDARSNLSLRDWFAGKALRTMVDFGPARIRAEQVEMSVEEFCARCAYAYADAMLAERKRK